MTEVPLWRLYVLRVSYALIAFGLAMLTWPDILQLHPASSLMQGVVRSMLAAVGLGALLGVRYPLQMLPVLMFEIAWKVIWLAAVALPLWLAGQMDAATQATAIECLGLVIVVAVMPWRYVLAHYGLKRSERWR